MKYNRKIEKTDHNSENQTCICIGKVAVPVSPEIADFDRHYRNKQRYNARRNGKCGQPDYRRCSGDCETCFWHQEGYRMLSLYKVLGPELEHETPDFNSSSSTLDEIVTGKMLLEGLYRQLDELIPDGARVFRLRAQNYSEREIVRALGIKSQSTLNHRLKKMDAFIRAHRTELEDLLH